MGINAKPITEVEVYRDIPIYIHRFAVGMECSVRKNDKTYWISAVNTKHLKLEYLNECKIFNVVGGEIQFDNDGQYFRSDKDSCYALICKAIDYMLDEYKEN